MLIYGRCIADDTKKYKPLNYIGYFSGITVLHSHSIVFSHGNALDFQCKFFLCTTKNRLADPSEICALDFKRKFRRSVICPDSATIGIDWSIIEIFCEAASPTRLKNTVSDGEMHLVVTAAKEGGVRLQSRSAVAGLIGPRRSPRLTGQRGARS